MDGRIVKGFRVTADALEKQMGFKKEVWVHADDLTDGGLCENKVKNGQGWKDARYYMRVS